MSLIDRLAEARIQEAVERGELSNLPGEGKPLELDDDSLVPPELRAGYRLLKNAGFLPPELEWRREVRDIEALLRCCSDVETGRRARLRLDLLRAQLEQRGRCSPLWTEQDYYEKLVDHLDRG